MADGVTVTDGHRAIARQGIAVQFKGHTGVEIEAADPGVRAFIEQQIEVVAHHIATQSFLHDILHPVVAMVHPDAMYVHCEFRVGEVASMQHINNKYPLGRITEISVDGREITTESGNIARRRGDKYLVRGVFVLIHGEHSNTKWEP